MQEQTEFPFPGVHAEERPSELEKQLRKPKIEYEKKPEQKGRWCGCCYESELEQFYS